MGFWYSVAPAGRGERRLQALRQTGADALHPGYGFLAENAAFARAVEAAGVRFIGPHADHIDAMGHKTRARELMARHGLPAGSGTPVLADDDAFLAAAQRIGYPVLVKPAGGGGGIGMAVARDPAQLVTALRQARSIAERAFATAELYLERLIEQPRHIEFQVLADSSGARHLFERDCSIQRRHQKVVEEAPAPGLARAEVEAMAARSAQALAGLGYDNIGTVETLRGDDGNYGFLEVNTRLQVEHAVTEMASGVDIVTSQIRLAAGEPLAAVLPTDVRLGLHAIEARVYAEDPKRFLPSPGPLDVFRPPTASADLRVDTGYAEGNRVTPFYDPLLAKLVTRAPTRDRAIAALDAALEAFEVRGVKTNIEAIRKLLAAPAYRAGALHTGLLHEVL